MLRVANKRIGAHVGACRARSYNTPVHLVTVDAAAPRVRYARILFIRVSTTLRR